MTKFKVGDRVIIKISEFEGYSGHKGTVSRFYNSTGPIPGLYMQLDEITLIEGRKLEQIGAPIHHFRKLRKKSKFTLGDRVIANNTKCPSVDYYAPDVSIGDKGKVCATAYDGVLVNFDKGMSVWQAAQCVTKLRKKIIKFKIGDRVLVDKKGKTLWASEGKGVITGVSDNCPSSFFVKTDSGLARLGVDAEFLTKLRKKGITVSEGLRVTFAGKKGAICITSNGLWAFDSDCKSDDSFWFKEDFLHGPRWKRLKRKPIKPEIGMRLKNKELNLKGTICFGLGVGGIRSAIQYDNGKIGFFLLHSKESLFSRGFVKLKPVSHKYIQEKFKFNRRASFEGQRGLLVGTANPFVVLELDSTSKLVEIPKNKWHLLRRLKKKSLELEVGMRIKCKKTGKKGVVDIYSALLTLPVRFDKPIPEGCGVSAKTVSIKYDDGSRECIKGEDGKKLTTKSHVKLKKKAKPSIESIITRGLEAAFRNPFQAGDVVEVVGNVHFLTKGMNFVISRVDGDRLHIRDSDYFMPALGAQRDGHSWHHSDFKLISRAEKIKKSSNPFRVGDIIDFNDKYLESEHSRAQVLKVEGDLISVSRWGDFEIPLTKEGTKWPCHLHHSNFKLIARSKS